MNSDVAMLTGGQDAAYAHGLATTLAARGMHVSVVGNARVDHADFHTSDRITFIDLGSIRSSRRLATKLFQLAAYYLRLVTYLTFGSPKIVHILWNSKLEYFDRTLLTFYLKLLGKKVVLTAHNVNKAKRDSCDSAWNRSTLKIQYELTDQIFVHTEKMRDELRQEFGIVPERVTVIPFGLNTLVPDTELTRAQAKKRLGVGVNEPAILFYGRIVPYKGLEFLIEAFHRLDRNPGARLIIAGEPMKGEENYLKRIATKIAEKRGSGSITSRFEFISDAETEVYFKAADVLVLPYKDIFESGVLYAAARFGVPVIASDVGSFGEEIKNGRAGFVFEPGSPAALADTLAAFLDCELYKDAANHRRRIREYFTSSHSWQTVGQITEAVYGRLVKGLPRVMGGDLGSLYSTDRELQAPKSDAFDKVLDRN